MKKSIIKIGGFVLVAFVLIFVSVRFTNAYGLPADGGVIDTTSVEECTCSGGELYDAYSFIDFMTHTYLYEYGATDEYPYCLLLGTGANCGDTGDEGGSSGVSSDGGEAWYLSSLTPYAICLIEEGEYCDTSEEQPEGMFLKIGTAPMSYGADGIPTFSF